jgi:ATP-binding cassette subfamily B protein
MSAVERLDELNGGTPPLPDSEPHEASSIEAVLSETPAKRTAKLRPLLALAPYIARYRWRAILALSRSRLPRLPRWWCRSRCGG